MPTSPKPPEGSASTPRLALRLSPDWEEIKAAWDPCQEFLARHGVDEELGYALCMASQEFLENAVKYGDFSRGGGVQLDVTLGREAVVEVRCPAARSEARLRQLDEAIQWIRGFQDPFEAWVERLKWVSSQPYAHEKSGLGLVRVAYEGQCVIDFYVDENDVLAISAVRDLPRRPLTP